ncbi:hypothetical protein DIE12_11300 [Burkholderia sp. Bp9015]|nr:hypothetical protein DIE12_11300 [Burkholderia sp. Bp9015]
MQNRILRLIQVRGGVEDTESALWLWPSRHGQALLLLILTVTRTSKVKVARPDELASMRRYGQFRALG